MENENKYKSIILILLFILIFIWAKYNNLKEENIILSGQLDEYRYALDQANENIEEVNSIIEDAQSYAWNSYQEMGEALDNLETVDTVSEP